MSKDLLKKAQAEAWDCTQGADFIVSEAQASAITQATATIYAAKIVANSISELINTIKDIDSRN